MKPLDLPNDRANVAGTRRRGAAGLLLGLAAMAFVWLVVLPHLASRDSVRQQLRFLEERRIDAGAMYYTELEAMTPILQKLHGQPSDGASPAAANPAE